MFRLLDENADSLIDFKELVSCLDLMYYGDFSENLKLLYRLHIPPACSDDEATSFSPLRTTFISSIQSDYLRKPNSEAIDHQRQLKKMLEDLVKSKTASKDLSLMSQRDFIQFCKSLYSMFREDPEENNLYQAIATVTTLLLQIGEEGQRTRSSSSLSELTSSKESELLTPTDAADSVFEEDLHMNNNPLSQPEDDWSVSFEQILASLLTEQSLVNFFEKSVAIKSKLLHAKANQYQQRINLTIH